MKRLLNASWSQGRSHINMYWINSYKSFIYFHETFLQNNRVTVPIVAHFLHKLSLYSRHLWWWSKQANKRKQVSSLSPSVIFWLSLCTFVKMDLILFSIFVATLLAALLPLFKRYKKYLTLQAIVNKIPGPPAYPIVGTSLAYIMTPREGHGSVTYSAPDY